MKLRKVLLVVVVILIGLIAFLYFSIKISPPKQDLSVINPSLKRDTISNGYKYGNNWIKKEKPGIWSMYIEGDGFERGYAIGILTKELAEEQEGYFIDEIKKKIPSSFMQFILRGFVGWFNRNIDEHITLEYQKEIYGTSFFASDKYSYVGPAYQRFLNYHAAHDIGHAMQNMNFVACTALGTWNQYSLDSSMYIGRNFDFYVGDDFAKDKIIAFINPKNGYKYISVTWGSMTGVLSGMNGAGLTVTLNADKSEIPSHTGTPVSLIAKEILQYASTIDEAYAIAQKRTCFVSESFMIGSTKDRKIAIIEKTPKTTAIYYPNDSRIVCANHFQSKALDSTKINIENMKDSTSVYREQRVEELLNEVSKMDEKQMVVILRDQLGHHNKPIGMRNEKAINQLLAHHGIIFQPYKKFVWISSPPFVEGEFMAIDFDKVFEEAKKPETLISISDKSKELPADSFLYTPTFKEFMFYHNTSQRLSDWLDGHKDEAVSEGDVKKLMTSNPLYFNAYVLAGDYYRKNSNDTEAMNCYKEALTKELSSVTDRKRIEERITKLQKKISEK